MAVSAAATASRLNELAPFLDGLVDHYHRPEHIGLDPLGFPKRFSDPADQEVAALLSAMLAWGRVQQISNVLTRLFDGLGPTPAQTLHHASLRDCRRMVGTLVHRTATSDDLARALHRIGCVLRRCGSLESAFTTHWRAEAPDVLEALVGFSEELRGPDANGMTRGLQHLFARPELGSACKRWLLFLRWVVRPRDGIDLGLWRSVPPAQLVIPLDTHIHRIAQNLRLTRRRDASLRTALEITQALRGWNADDPVKCDFSLTRLGILQVCPSRVDPAVCFDCGLKSVCRHGLAL